MRKVRAGGPNVASASLAGCQSLKYPAWFCSTTKLAYWVRGSYQGALASHR